jgi:hypothetical protein
MRYCDARTVCRPSGRKDDELLSHIKGLTSRKKKLLLSHVRAGVTPECPTRRARRPRRRSARSGQGWESGYAGGPLTKALEPELPGSLRAGRPRAG